MSFNTGREQKSAGAVPRLCFSGGEGLFPVTLFPTVFIQVHFKLYQAIVLSPHLPAVMPKYFWQPRMRVLDSGFS